jgi:cbb3-type cytochrome oxidase subunit 1
MHTQDAGLTWLRLAAVYFSLAVIVGIGMGISEDHSLFPVHAHLNLLGWVSMALFGLIYRHFQEAGRNRLAKTQFWLYNLGLPVMMVSLALKLTGFPQIEPVLGASSLVVACGAVLFTVNLLLHARPAAQPLN